MQTVTRVRRVANPRRKARKKSSAKRRNPARAYVLGATNPRRKRGTTMRRRRTTRRRRNTAAPRRRTSVRRRRTYRASAAPRRRRRNPTRRSRRTVSARRRRNPTLFGGNVSTAQMTEAIIGGLVGVTATKTITAAAPGQLVATPIMRVVTSIASALASGWVAKMVSPRFGDAVMFGGLMQAGSVALNTFIPSVGGTIGLSGGLGDLVPGAYPVPQNPLNPAQLNYPAYGGGAYGATAPVEMNGIGRAFGRAF